MKSRSPMLIALALAACAPSSPEREAPATDIDPFAPTEEQRVEILETVQAVFDAIESRDGSSLDEIFVPGARMGSVRPSDGGGTTVRESTVEEFAASITGTEAEMVERIWEAEVRLSGSLASVWAPYDFYLDGAFSHCGVDTVHLTRGEDGWRIVALTWSALQPPDCALHPEGPPGG